MVSRVTGGRATLTVEELAAELGIGLRQAYELVAAGGIHSVRVGRRILVPRAALDAFLTEPAQETGEGQ